MSNQVQFSTFNFKDLPVRVIIDPTAEYWFCGKDVCDILGYTNDSKALKDHCKENGVTKRYLIDSMNRKQEAIFINEPNLYRLIIKSRKPEAEPFEAWVFEEVLPTIRKTGSYNAKPTLPAPEKMVTLQLTEYELQNLAWAWYALKRGADTFQRIYPAVKQLGSHFAPEIYGQGYEYLHTIKEAHAVIKRMTKDFTADPRTNWRVLQHVSDFDQANRTRLMR